MEPRDFRSSLLENRREFEEVVKEIRPDLHRYCARIVGSAIDAEDVVQDALAKAFYSLPTMTVANMPGWLMRIAHNKAIDFLRREGRQHVEYAEEFPVADEPDVPLQRHEALTVALSVFLKLTPKQRSCVVLKDVMDYSLAEISELLLALPAVQSSFGVTASTTQWALSAYALSFGGFLLLGGKAGDLFGRRRVLVTGYAVFSLASLLGGLAPTMQWFVAARALQGLGAALISPTAFAAATTLFPDARRSSRVIAIWSALSGVAFPAGALIGGLLVGGPGWRWIMFVNVPLGLVSGSLAPAFLPPGAASSGRRRLDVQGATTATLGLVALVWVLGEGHSQGWTSATIVLPAILAVGLLVAFVAIEKRSQEPVLRLDIFRDPSLAGANLSVLAGNGGLVASLFGLSYFLQRSLSLGPEASGIAFVPTALIFVIATHLSSRLAPRLPARLLVVAGSIAMATGFLLYSRMSSAIGFLVPFLCGSAFVGLFGLALPVIFKVGVATVPPAHRGAAAGLLNTSQQVGGAVGLAIETIVQEAARASAGAVSRIARDVAGTQHGFIACAIFLAIGAAAALALIRMQGPRLGTGEP